MFFVGGLCKGTSRQQWERAQGLIERTWAGKQMRLKGQKESSNIPLTIFHLFPCPPNCTPDRAVNTIRTPSIVSSPLTRPISGILSSELSSLLSNIYNWVLVGMKQWLIIYFHLIYKRVSCTSFCCSSPLYTREYTGNHLLRRTHGEARSRLWRFRTVTTANIAIAIGLGWLRSKWRYLLHR